MNQHLNDSPTSESQRIRERTRQIRRLFIILLSIGLVGGGILGFGVVKVLKKLGLTEKTPQFEHLKER